MVEFKKNYSVSTYNKIIETAKKYGLKCRGNTNKNYLMYGKTTLAFDNEKWHISVLNEGYASNYVAGISWASLGSRKPSETKEFAKALNDAVKFSEYMAKVKDVPVKEK